MILSRRRTKTGVLWFADDRALPEFLSLGQLLGERRSDMRKAIEHAWGKPVKHSRMLCPAEQDQEVWAAGVTYLRSRDERQAESKSADLYGKVYEAERPELFFKSAGWRAVGHGGKIRVRKDSDWNVPEPELTLVVNRFGEIVGYTAGNDVSSRRIEGENPLYLPQAKSYDGSCALGPAIVLSQPEELIDLPISCGIKRGEIEVFAGETRSSQMKRLLPELVEYLFRETSFPRGVFLMTGTGIVPEPGFTLLTGDVVTIRVGELTLANEVEQNL